MMLYHFVLCAVIADASLYRKILFLKVDILPSQPAYFADPKTSIIGYLYWQNPLPLPFVSA